MLLSIIVISHNQKDQLRRCLNSILAQSLPFEHEIIISDDASNDGTWELAQEYESQYSVIKAYSCDTTVFLPANASDRCGWNKCNAYRHATGKYIAHVDGDDFFLEGKDVYKKQVELLEQNPTCSCCMANIYRLEEYEDVSNATIIHKEIFKSGTILSSEDYLRHYFRQFQCFVYRRNVEIDPVKLYGGYYDDSLITTHHLQFGDIVCLNDAGYVYVHSESSIWSQQVKCHDDIIFAHAIYLAILIPKWRFIFYSSPGHLYNILKVVRLAQSGHKLREANLRWVEKFDSFLYHSFNRPLSLSDRVHLSFLAFYLRILKKFKPKIKLPYRLLSSLI